MCSGGQRFAVYKGRMGYPLLSRLAASSQPLPGVPHEPLGPEDQGDAAGCRPCVGFPVFPFEILLHWGGQEKGGRQGPGRPQERLAPPRASFTSGTSAEALDRAVVTWAVVTHETTSETAGGLSPAPGTDQGRSPVGPRGQGCRVLGAEGGAGRQAPRLQCGSRWGWALVLSGAASLWKVPSAPGWSWSASRKDLGGRVLTLPHPGALLHPECSASPVCIAGRRVRSPDVALGQGQLRLPAHSGPCPRPCWVPEAGRRRHSPTANPRLPRGAR